MLLIVLQVFFRHGAFLKELIGQFRSSNAVRNISSILMRLVCLQVVVEVRCLTCIVLIWHGIGRVLDADELEVLKFLSVVIVLILLWLLVTINHVATVLKLR